MRGDPQIEVHCDKCNTYNEFVGLTALSRGSYDERNVDGELKRAGWICEGGEDVCPECAAEISDERT
jgi:hypothetical protein